MGRLSRAEKVRRELTRILQTLESDAASCRNSPDPTNRAFAEACELKIASTRAALEKLDRMGLPAEWLERYGEE